MAEKMLSRTGFVIIGRQSGHTVIAKNSPLTRLHFFDGKFLRAPDLKLEQRAWLSHVQLSNQADGLGIAYGYDCTSASSDRLHIGAGLAIDPQGRVLHLPEEVDVGIADLIEKSRARDAAIRSNFVVAEGVTEFEDCTLRVEEEPSEVLAGSDLYVITVGHAEAYCGEEDVYGKLCEEACISSTERPYIIEGVIIRAVPLNLSTQLPTSSEVPLSHLHLRSQVASAYFEQESQKSPASHISGAGLLSTSWCHGADATGGTDIPIALLSRSGSTTRFLDAWIVRRERMESPPRHYWAWRMAMRPFKVFLAQVLQFQCQLAQCFKDGIDKPPIADPCEDERAVVIEAAETIGLIKKQFAEVSARIAEAVELSAAPTERMVSVAELTLLEEKLAAVKAKELTNRYLINCGIIELPSAGYLPVSPVDTMTVNEQVRRMMGEGVDLRFCVVRPDYIPHALEEAQHMERISLLEGLDDPAAKPAVDVLVPDGEIVTREVQAESLAFRGTVNLVDMEQGSDGDILQTFQLRGAGRADELVTGGGAFYFAGAGDPRQILTRAPEDINRSENLAVAGIGARKRHFFTWPGRAVESAAAESASDIREISSISAVSVKLPSFIIATWAALRCEQNPFTMKPGDTTPSSLYVVVATSSKRTTVFREIQFQGSFHLETIRGSGSGGNEVTLTGPYLAVVKGRGEDSDGPIDEFSAGLDLHATLRLRQGVSSFQFELDMLDKNSADKDPTPFHSVVNWSGDPMNVVLREGSGQFFITGAKLNEDRTVLVPDDSDHNLALTGLEVVGAALNDPGFAERAAELLFPEETAPKREVQVRATKDWVLFHRRRSKVCEADIVTPMPVAARRYLVWHLIVDQEQLQDIIKALRSNNALLEDLNFIQVSLVEYAATTPTLRSSPDAIRSDWQAVNPGDLLVYGAIASSGAAQRDGEILALGRLDRMREVLHVITPAQTDAEFETLLQVPDRLGVTGTDGAIVLLTMSNIRVGRIVIWQDDQNNRTLIHTDIDLLVQFEADGSIKGVLPNRVMAELQPHTDLIELEIAPEEGQTEPNATKRRDAIFNALMSNNLLHPSATHKVSPLKASEQDLLTRDGIKANDIIFLRKG